MQEPTSTKDFWLATNDAGEVIGKILAARIDGRKVFQVYIRWPSGMRPHGEPHDSYDKAAADLKSMLQSS